MKPVQVILVIDHQVPIKPYPWSSDWELEYLIINRVVCKISLGDFHQWFLIAIRKSLSGIERDQQEVI